MCARVATAASLSLLFFILFSYFISLFFFFRGEEVEDYSRDVRRVECR
jgi:hypothetical protein